MYYFLKNVSKGVITTNLRRVVQLSNLAISFGKNIIPVSVSLLDIYDFTNKIIWIFHMMESDPYTEINLIMTNLKKFVKKKLKRIYFTEISNKKARYIYPSVPYIYHDLRMEWSPSILIFQ